MAAKKKPTDTITVRVVSQPINEEGIHYPQGAEFATTPERAAALGSLVEAVAPQADAAPQ